MYGVCCDMYGTVTLPCARLSIESTSFWKISFYQHAITIRMASSADRVLLSMAPSQLILRLSSSLDLHLRDSAGLASFIPISSLETRVHTSYDAQMHQSFTPLSVDPSIQR